MLSKIPATKIKTNISVVTYAVLAVSVVVAAIAVGVILFSGGLSATVILMSQCVDYDYSNQPVTKSTPLPLVKGWTYDTISDRTFNPSVIPNPQIEANADYCTLNGRKTSSCSGIGCGLMERYCANNRRSSRYYLYNGTAGYNRLQEVCPDGCNNGACVAITDPNNFGECQPLIYKGDVKNNINVVFVSSVSSEDEENLKNSLLGLFNKEEKFSFYSIKPFSSYENNFNFFYLNSEVSSLPEAKQAIKDKCSGLGKDVYQIMGLQPLNIGGTSNNYFKSAEKVGFQTTGVNKYTRLIALHFFLHEFGHSFGGLGEGYGKGFDEGILDVYKENYNNNSNLPPNWDIEGCPKWCSGQVNTDSVCYLDYLSLKKCLLSSKTTQDAINCSLAFNSAIENKGLSQPYDCDFGISCKEETNCWFIGNGFFRAHDYDLMFSSSDSMSFVEGLFKPSYGPAGEEQIEKTIQAVKLWSSQKNEINEVKFEIVESGIENFEGSYDVKVKFKLLDLNGNILTFFRDNILDDIITIKYKKPLEAEYYEIPILKKDAENNLIVEFSTGGSEKEDPLTELNFIIEINLPKFEKSWDFIVKAT